MYVPVEALVLKKDQAHSWSTYSYHELKSDMTMAHLREGIKNSFVAHYFGSKFDNGQLKLKMTSPLITLMEENCPVAVKQVIAEIKAE